MISTSEVSKPWQSVGSTQMGFKPKKPFMPRLVRSKNPDHVIGYGSTLQVSTAVREEDSRDPRRYKFYCC